MLLFVEAKMHTKTKDDSRMNDDPHDTNYWFNNFIITVSNAVVKTAPKENLTVHGEGKMQMSESEARRKFRERLPLLINYPFSENKE